MADTSYPFDGQSINEGEWSKFARLYLGDGVVPFPSSVGTGYNTPLSVFGDSSGMQVKQRAGVCAVQGFYFERSTDNTTIAIGSNSSGSTRIDRIVAKLDRAGNNITIVAKQGTTSPPSLQQDAAIWEMSLAQVSVANGAATISAANVTDERKLSRRIGDLPQGLVAAPKFSTSVLSTTGTTVLKDTGVGDLTFSADASAYYRITYTARALTSSASARMALEIRDGGTSSPTASSTLLAATTVRVPTSSSDGATQVCFTEILGPSLNASLAAGTHTIALFYYRSDTVSAAAVSLDSFTGSARQLSVVNLGYFF